MCDGAISENPFMLAHCLGKYKTQKMCDKAVNDCLAALKLIFYWFVTSEMIKKILAALYVDDNILCLK